MPANRRYVNCETQGARASCRLPGNVPHECLEGPRLHDATVVLITIWATVLGVGVVQALRDRAGRVRTVGLSALAAALMVLERSVHPPTDGPAVLLGVLMLMAVTLATSVVWRLAASDALEWLEQLAFIALGLLVFLQAGRGRHCPEAAAGALEVILLIVVGTLGRAALKRPRLRRLLPWLVATVVLLWLGVTLLVHLPLLLAVSVGLPSFAVLLWRAGSFWSALAGDVVSALERVAPARRPRQPATPGLAFPIAAAVTVACGVLGAITVATTLILPLVT